MVQLSLLVSLCHVARLLRAIVLESTPENVPVAGAAAGKPDQQVSQSIHLVMSPFSKGYM
jgi:hypothetical protein